MISIWSRGEWLSIRIRVCILEPHGLGFRYFGIFFYKGYKNAHAIDMIVMI